MERVVTIFLAGKNYRITESAYKLLTNYDRFLNKKYKDPEFLLDVETQMAAIFDTDLMGKDTVLERKDVEEAIRLIGINENINYYPGNYTSASTSKVYRNTKRSVIGGVAAGFADYLNVDPVLIRVLFVLLTVFFGPGLLVYIVLWIVLPAQKNKVETENRSMISKSKK